MKKFRIVKITETNDLGDNKINYIIQKKLWFLWYDYKIARVNYVGLAMRSTVKKEKILFLFNYCFCYFFIIRVNGLTNTRDRII